MFLRLILRAPLTREQHMKRANAKRKRNFEKSLIAALHVSCRLDQSCFAFFVCYRCEPKHHEFKLCCFVEWSEQGFNCVNL